MKHLYEVIAQKPLYRLLNIHSWLLLFDVLLSVRLTADFVDFLYASSIIILYLFGENITAMFQLDLFLHISGTKGVLYFMMIKFS